MRWNNGIRQRCFPSRKNCLLTNERLKVLLTIYIYIYIVPGENVLLPLDQNIERLLAAKGIVCSFPCCSCQMGRLYLRVVRIFICFNQPISKRFPTHEVQFSYFGIEVLDSKRTSKVGFLGPNHQNCDS